ncbi:hypothetical protein JCM13991_07950 [Thermodesulfovibrio hydrogeniphilus]
MLYLSKKAKENATAIAEEIAKEMQIPMSFLRKILKKLEKAGLLQIKRGVSGGIKLLKLPHEITLYDVIVAMEKEIALNRCVTSKKTCGLSKFCPVHPVWFKVKARLIEALKEINFAQLSGAAS